MQVCVRTDDGEEEEEDFCESGGELIKCDSMFCYQPPPARAMAGPFVLVYFYLSKKIHDGRRLQTCSL